MPYILTIPDQAEAAAALEYVTGSSGQGDFIRDLAKMPLAKSELLAGKPKRMDHIHLSRFDDTDYCQWYGRCSDGFHRPIGRIMQIIEISVPQD